MAEFVQQSIEEMLPELEQMERVGLFTAVETRAIIRKRKAYEYKLRRRTKQKEDFLQYIQYEMNVLALIRKRRENTGYSFKKVEIDVAVIQRIHKLFKLVCYRFQDDIKLWLSHIEFCKKRGEKAPVSRLFNRVLQVHSRKANVWVLAAKWEMEDNLSMDNARSLLQRGLRFNPTSRLLWQEYFRMELLNADKLRKRKEVLGLAGMEDEVVSDALLSGKVAHIVFCKAVENFQEDVEFWLSFLTICRLFDFTAALEDFIYSQLEEKHPTSELTWDALARRCLHSVQQQGEAEDAAENEALVKQQERECWKTYDKATSQINTELMWTLYIKACLERLNLKACRTVTEQRVAKVTSVFHRALGDECLSQEMFLEWLRVLLKTGQSADALVVCQTATEQYPTSVTVWRHRLSLQMVLQAEHTKILQVLQEALKNVPEKDSLPLYEMAVEWCAINQPEHIQTLLERGVLLSGEVGAKCKELYLEWTALHTDIHQTRNLYTRLSGSKPLSADFFIKYINIENSQPSPKMKRLRQAYEDAVKAYGATDTDIWLNYIKLEQEHSKGKPENAGKLHWRAMKALDDSLTQHFITQHTLLQTGHLKH